MVYFLSLLLIIITIVITFLLIQYYWENRKFFKLASELDGPRAWPILGNALLLAGKPEDVTAKMIKLTEQYESPSRFWLGPKLVVEVSKPEDIEAVMQNALNKADVYNLLKPLLGDGLFTSTVDRWKNQRKKIVSAFNQKTLESLVGTFQEKSDCLLKRLAEKVNTNPFDIFPFASAFTLDAICQTAMDVDVNAQNGHCKYIEYAEGVFALMYQRMIKFWLHFDFIFNLTPLSKEQDKFIDYLHSFSRTVIEKKRKIINSKISHHESDENEFHTSKREPFLDILIKQANFTDQEIRDHVDVLTFAGNDTTATALSFCLLMLAMHPQIQNKVYEELNEIFGDSERPINVSDLSNLKYMELVIKETLRLFPVGPVMAREATNDFKMGKHFIPKGTMFLISILSNHRNSKHWPNPELFIPERFLPEEMAKRHPYSFLPFAGGPRNCIGIRYAYISLKVALANILRKYKLTTPLKMEDITLKIEFTMKISPGFMISVSPRQ